jgi:alpha-D-xyloside xylohydrolase
VSRRVLFFTGVALVAACSSGSTDVPQAPPGPGSCVQANIDHPPAPIRKTARWAFEPWISKDISDRQDTYDFVGGFQSRGIPIGAVVLDSPWETNYNTFTPNPNRYGDFNGMVNDMHAKGVKVVLWITAYVDNYSFDLEPGSTLYDGPAANYQQGYDCHYYIDDGEDHVWWKGRGGSIDFFDENARTWFHRAQDQVLDAGIDGWKLDFGENYLNEPTVKTVSGVVPFQQYSEKYYEDYLTYGRFKRGNDFVTMTRAWDVSYEFQGRFFARKEHSPVAWMGDNTRDYAGLADALDEAFVSSNAGYVVVGSDIGGYLDVDDKNLAGPQIPFDTTVFARWTAIGALSPFMELHGRANLAPWTVPDHVDETVALYKYWATLHHALVPYLYSGTEEAYAGGPMLVRPIGDPASWPNDYRYQLGDAFLVAPILDATGTRQVPLPAGSRWLDWWTGTIAGGGTTVSADYSKDTSKIPLFLREGAIVPLAIEDDTLKLGDASSKGSLTLLVWPSAGESSFKLHEEDDTVTTIDAKGTTITVSTAPKPIVFRVHADTAPVSVTLDGAPATFDYDTNAHAVIVHAPAKQGSIALTVGP